MKGKREEEGQEVHGAELQERRGKGKRERREGREQGELAIYRKGKVERDANGGVEGKKKGMLEQVEGEKFYE